MVGGIGFLLILLLEKVLVRAEETDTAASANPYILMAILSVHSIIAGMALGLESATAGAVILLVAILIHKSFAAFALGISFETTGLSKRRYYSYLSFFSLMTPLGVLLGALLNRLLHNQTALALEAIFDGLAGGTFIYIASMDVIGRSFADDEMRWGKYGAIALGYGLMALLAVWT
jgi:zinc transporter 1/2/3